MIVFASATAPALWGGASVVQFIRKVFPNQHRLTLALLLVAVSVLDLWRAWPRAHEEIHDTHFNHHAH